MTVRKSILGNEAGTALVATLMFLMAMGVLSTALVFTVQSDVKTSASYKYGQQAFFEANAAVQNAVDWFANSYAPHASSVDYDLTVMPVKYQSENVLLAGQSGYSAVYPDDNVIQAFSGRLGNKVLAADDSNSGSYAVNATLLRHRIAQFMDPTTLETHYGAIERWRLDCVGYWGRTKPLGVSRITATIENNGEAFFDRALWGKREVNLRGAMLIDSYNPKLGPWDETTNYGYNGAIGSNGLVDMGGNATIRGDVGLGPTATYQPGGTLTGDIIRLSEDREFTPVPSFDVGTQNETVRAMDELTIKNQQYANKYNKITVHGTLIFEPGTYYIDELTEGAQGKIVVTGDTILYVKTGLTLTGQGIVNSGMNTNNLTIFYGGTQAVAMEGGSSAYIEFYGPGCDLTLRGNVDFSGSFVANNVIVGGGARVHYSNSSLQRHLLPRPFRLITWSQDSL